MSKGQNKILDTLMEKPKSIQDLIYDTGLSMSFIRLQLKYLEASAQVEKVDDRVPYLYRIPTTSPRMRQRELISLYRVKILEMDKDNSIVKMLSQAPKNQWITIADDLEATAIAIRNLDSEGLLIETLEV